jgi:hypothetical protein
MRREMPLVFLLVCLTALDARAQVSYSPQPGSSTVSTGAQGGPVAPPVFSGSVPSGAASRETLSLSLREAIARGLKQNLGAVLSSYDVGGARGEKWRELSSLLPDLNA